MPSPQKRGGTMRALMLASEVGVTLPVCILIGVFLGRYLDGLLHTSPWMLFLCSLLGMAAAFKMIFTLAKKFRG